MQQRFFPITKRLVVMISAFMVWVQVDRLPVWAEETTNEKVETISQLMDDIHYFYLHPNATEFMNSFYTSASYEHLRAAFNQAQEKKEPDWETELDDAALTELYQLLHLAVAGLRPIMIHRGEAIAQNQNLNFRAVPETETQVFHTLTYGTSFEILEEVRGGIVVGDDLVPDDRWLRIRHNDQSGYVHAKYVRVLPVSEERIGLLADIGRQELRIQAKIDGWQTPFSPDTQAELQGLLSSARALQVGNWQFDLSYSELNHLLQSLSYEHLNLVTLFRHQLISDIVRLKREIENQVQSASMENYTEASWEEMEAALSSAQTLLVEGWQDNLDDETLEGVYELLLSGLNGLEQISEAESDVIEVDAGESVNSDVNPQRILILGAFALAGFSSIFLTLKIIKLIQHRKFNE